MAVLLSPSDPGATVSPFGVSEKNRPLGGFDNHLNFRIVNTAWQLLRPVPGYLPRSREVLCVGWKWNGTDGVGNLAAPNGRLVVVWFGGWVVCVMVNEWLGG